jgi:surface antigen
MKTVMRSRTGRVVLAAGLALVLGACSGPTGGYKQPVGGALGAAGGGFLGSQIGSGKGQLAATAAGALLGGLMGLEAGASLDRADQVHAAQAYPQRAQVPTWRSPAYPAPQYYSHPPASYGSSYGASDGCRSGNAGAMRGLVCEQPDGTWRFIPQ